jgi:hypothetical protein
MNNTPKNIAKRTGTPPRYKNLVNKEKKIIRAIQTSARKLTKNKNAKTCAVGEIKKSPTIRRGYTKKTPNGKVVHIRPTIVHSTCITNRGLKGKSSRKIHILRDEHHLSDAGYHTTASTRDRHAALRKVMHNKPTTTVRRMLIARSNLLKRTNPKASETMKKDEEWVKTESKKLTK